MEIKISQEELHRSYQEYLSSPEKFCEICASEMTERCVTLDCGHKFHYDCLFYSIFKNNNYKIKNNKVKNNNLQCPYCRYNLNFIPLIEGVVPLKNIHKEYDNYILMDNLKYPIDSRFKVTSGKYKDKFGKIINVGDVNVEVLLDCETKTKRLNKVSIEIL